MRKIAFSLAAPVGAFVLTLVVSTIALVAFGSNPAEAYGDMIGHAANSRPRSTSSIERPRSTCPPWLRRSGSG